MVTVMSLWLPILVSAVLVFIASSIIHMFLPYHKNDFEKVPDEDALMDALRASGVPPGDYVVPHASSMAAMKDPAYVEKRTRGPSAFITVMSGDMGMGAQLAQWFVFCVVVSIFAAYNASRALGLAGGAADYLDVFRFAGTMAFAGYALASAAESIWFKRKWSTTVKSMFDGLVFALLTAGVFGWLWPS
jgi:hypothetical protein